MSWLKKVVIICTSFVLIIPLGLYAGSTGKIAGMVADAGSGEGLPGVNIEILDTSLGSSTDLGGNYVILNVAPGTYTLRFSMIGYKTVEVSEIRVFIDRIAKVEIELSEAIMEGEVITVVAEREAVEFDRTNTSAYVSKEEIEVLPVATLTDIISLQAGIVTDAGGGIHIRGGRTREVAYMVDGVPVTDTFSQSGGSNVKIENNFIRELQVITGTFNAEYGSAQSGVINVVTKGLESNFTGNLQFLTGGYYAPDKPQYVGGLDSYDILNDKELRFSISVPINFFPNKLGKLGFLVNGRIVDSGGWLNGERRFMPEDGWEIAVYREWYQATYDPEDPLAIPIPDSLHTGDGEIVAMNWNKSYNINAKLVYQPISTLTVAYSMFFSTSEGQGFSNSWKFCPDGVSTYNNDNITHMLVLTHTPAENVYYNLRYSFQSNEKMDYMYEDANDPRYQITAVNSWDPGINTGYDYGGINSWDRNWFDQQVHLFNSDLTWQINNLIEVKAGFEARSYELNYKNAPMKEEIGYEILQFPYTQSEIRGLELPYEFFREATANYEYGNIRLRESQPDLALDDLYYVSYNRYPLEGAGYLQTKLNMGEIVLNAGLRMDYFWANDRYAPSYVDAKLDKIGDNRYYQQVESKYQFSPRLGLSFPISSRGALRLSYGHFFQTPSYEKMYENPVLPHYNQFSVANTSIGNPNLKPEKTIQYEVGLQQELVTGLAMELSVYYKDIRDLLGIEIMTLSNATTFRRYVNKEYGNSSGITFALNYRSINAKLNASVDYTYMVAKGTSSSPEAAVDVQILSGPGQGAYTLATRRIGFLNWDQTHSLNASVSLMPRPDWYVSMVGQLGSGLPYTPSTLNESIEIPGGWWDNIDRKPLRWNVDFRASKAFSLLGVVVKVNLNIFNLFSHLDENRVHSITGHAGPNAYLPELGRIRYQRIDTIGKFTHDEADYNPSWYSKPRFIQLGLNFEF